MKWSVRDLLHFSYSPGVNEAYEGTWASGDPIPDDMGLDWLVGVELDDYDTDEEVE